MVNLSAARGHLAKTWIQWVLAGLVFFSISFFYMGPAITSCSTTTTAFNSDSTGGLAWFQWASGNHLTWRHTDKSNYPVGEAVNRPQFITSQAFDVPYRLLSTMSSPICGLNLMLLLGYMSTALLMFGLVRWLFKRTAIAYFAGYAAAFVPFHQFKAQSHIVYASSAIFIAILWAFLWFTQRPSYARASLMAAVTALGFYFDGYFILFTSILIVSLILFSLIQRLFGSWSVRGLPKLNPSWKSYLLAQVRYLAYFFLLLLVFLLPIIYTQIKHGQDIKQSMAPARGNIKAESITYSTRPVEFLLPSFNNPLMPAGYGAWRLANQHSSNTSEDNLYVGYVIIVLALWALITVFRQKTKRLQLSDNISYRGLIIISAATLLISFLFSLPYRFTAAGHTFYTPTALLIKLTSNWRVLSRFFLVIDPLAIILAAAGIYIIVRKWPRHLYVSFVSLCFVVLFFEYLTSPLRPHGDLYKDSPPIYQSLARDTSVKVIAEYPLTGLSMEPSTFTFAQVHGKKLINANDTAISRDAFHSAIAGLNDKQTLGVLKARAVDVITTLGLDERSNSDLVSYSPADIPKGRSGPTVFAYRISDTVNLRPLELVASRGFFDLSVDDNQISHRVLRKNGMMTIMNLGANNPTGQYLVDFSARTLSGVSHLTISQNGRTLWNYSLVNAEVQFSASTASPIELNASSPIDITNMEAL